MVVGTLVDEDIPVGVTDCQLRAVVVVLEIGLLVERGTMGALDSTWILRSGLVLG